jgi:hypothetical protein
MCSFWNADGGNLWQAVPKVCSSLFNNNNDDDNNNNKNRHTTPGASRPSAHSSPQFLVPVWLLCMYASFCTFGLGSFLRCFLDSDVL